MKEVSLAAAAVPGEDAANLRRDAERRFRSPYAALVRRIPGA
jgi:hypothetical protein